MSQIDNHGRVLVSTVIPVFQGEGTLAQLTAQLQAVGRQWRQGGLPFELIEAIFVDDASIDHSGEILCRLEQQIEIVRVVTLSRNFGQHPATVAGILHSSGDWVVTLDEDLQHRPEEIVRLLETAVTQRLDVVYACSEKKVHSLWYRDLASRTYKALLALATGNQNIRDFNSFRAVRGSVARAAAAVVAHDTFLDIALGWFIARIGTWVVELRDERETQSGYTFVKLLSHARRAIVSSQTKWLRLGAGIGMGALAVSLLLLVWILGQKLIAPASIQVRGWTSLFLSVTFFGGLTSFLVGVVLEYLSTFLLSAHGKPTFFVIDRSIDDTPGRFFARRGADYADSQETDRDGWSE